MIWTLYTITGMAWQAMHLYITATPPPLGPFQSHGYDQDDSFPECAGGWSVPKLFCAVIIIPAPYYSSLFTRLTLSWAYSIVILLIVIGPYVLQLHIFILIATHIVLFQLYYLVNLLTLSVPDILPIIPQWEVVEVTLYGSYKLVGREVIYY